MTSATDDIWMPKLKGKLETLANKTETANLAGVLEPWIANLSEWITVLNKSRDEELTFAPLYLESKHSSLLEWFETLSDLERDYLRFRGGMTETFALGRFGAGGKPRKDAPLTSLRHAVAASSLVPGGAINEEFDWSKFNAITKLLLRTVLPDQDKLKWVGLTQPYPTQNDAEDGARDTVVDVQQGDGGLVDNAQLLPMLQRKVTCVTLLISTERPLNGTWNPKERPLTETNIDTAFAGYFGFVPEGTDSFQDFGRDQVFPSEAFAPFVEKMHAAMAKGTGIVVQADLETQKNEWWGIESGQPVKLTVLYLSRASKWWEGLPKETQEFLDDSSRTCKPFPHCPTVSSTFGLVRRESMLALTSLVAWTVQQNKEIFESAMRCPSPKEP
eukprot:gnl/MRDRNA2_/MRDRNA2_248011_c0_seq1.p1 gnl/MRDRNA2_/MRDRNA2_248011_c0~~gnl/MRDRNA2_/MRDRNA2_248011_c0_seq1.p1  ORF type:complete len:403 (-),score=83.36 gnl/MRDRNA2_/MRDRNA2_248011_c0_seq1:146-1306(-)